MNTAKVAVLGTGISGPVCATILARDGFCVTMFESARGPAGRMSQRREVTGDGTGTSCCSITGRRRATPRFLVSSGNGNLKDSWPSGTRVSGPSIVPLESSFASNRNNKRARDMWESRE